MIKINLKNKKNVYIVLIVILSLLLIGTIINVAFASKNKNKKIQETNFEPIAEENTEISIQELEEEIAENTVAEENKINTNSQINTKSTYYIKINYSANVVTIYTKDQNGEFTVPAKAMVCSTGTATPTSGTYSVKSRWRWLSLFGGVYGQYSTQIVGNILFHSVPYLEKSNPASLEYWEYDKLGTNASMGCIRLTVQDAKWIYDNISRGTSVEFYSDSNPGPLGKPGSQKISNNEQCRNWDPTDPTEGNPWRNIPVVEEPKQNNNSITNTTVKNVIENKVINNTIINEVNNTIANTTKNIINNIIQNNVITNIVNNITNNNSINNIINNVTNNTIKNNVINNDI